MTQSTLGVEVYEGEIFLVAYREDHQVARFHLDPEFAEFLGLKLKRAAVEAERLQRAVPVC